jgi:phospho-N-acetylmuramoyl-pentapeptide-transferase
MSPLVRILVPAAISFAIGIAMTPLLTYYLYTYKAWKKRPGKTALDGHAANEFNRLHHANETRAPRMGGIVVWGAVALTVFGIAACASLFGGSRLHDLNFLSRSQTWLPLATLLVGAFTGIIDDLMIIRPHGNGLRLRYRLVVVIALSTFIGWWFYSKLAVTAVDIPLYAPLEMGWFIIPLFILISLALYASGVIDGIDGLSGGVFASIFASYAIIAFTQNQIDLAAFCACVLGGLLAFLWFNIPPARFYMSDTGTMALTLAIGTVAFMTDNLGGGYGIAVLPIIGGILVVTVASDIAQMLWKKMFGVKLLRIAPLHHHFEAIGWPGAKVTMRYWVLSIILAFLGVIIALSALPAMPQIPLN